MADITVDVNLPNAISVDVTSPTQALATNISIPGPQGPRGEKGNPTSINSLTAENIIITGVDGNIAYTSGTSTIFVSGNSGYFQSAVNSLTTNLNSTGANLNTSINNLSGLFTEYTGSLDATYATDSQLNSTGNTLNIKIDNLSGYVDTQDSNISNNLASTGSSLQININTLSSNLSLTGANLNDKINSLSGTLTGNYATIVNLASTGNTLNSNINSLSGLFTGYTGTLDATFASDIQVANTGTTLTNTINSLSGTLTSTYATITNLASTGNNLDGKIGSLSGTLTSNYATITNLASTGSTLVSSINSLNSAFTGFTGNLDTTYATDSQLTSTGSTLVGSINSLSGYINSTSSNIIFTTGNQIKSGRLAIGDAIVDSSYPYTLSLQSNTPETWLEILNHSGANQGVFFGIAGNNFEQWNSQAGDILFVTSENPMDGTERLRIKNNGKVGIGTSSPSEKLEVAGNIIANNLVYNTGNQTVSGAKTFTEDLVVQKSGFFWSGIKIGLNSIIITEESIKISGDPVIVQSTFTGYTGDVANTYATITNLALTGSTLNNSINSLSGTLTSTYATINNLASTGSTLQSNINTLTNNLNSTGNTLDNKIGSLSGTLTSTYATISNLASTGSTLNTKINDLSGYVNTQDNSISNNLISTGNTLQNSINSLSGSSVLLYGNQSVGGVKTFRDNVYINNLFVTGTETIVSTNNFNVQSPYVLLNLTGGAVDGGIFFVTGNGLTGINDSGPIIGFDHSNKFKFGVSTRNSDLSTLPDIASVQDIIAYSGVADNKFSTITNLASTGNTLDQKISSLSGTLTSTYATISNLASTGSTLNSNINSLSGTLTSTYATISNLASTGSTLATNLASTGNTLNSSINSLSGTLTSNYATISNLASTGSTLVSSINSLSGTLTSTYATINNLASTGSTLNTRINTLSGYINSTSSNIVFTTGNQTISGTKTFIQDTTFGDSAQGDFLVISGNNFTVYGSGNFTSGLFVNSSPVLTGSSTLYATTVNLASTGSTLVTSINSLSGTLTGNYATILNLASTGNTLNTRINSLSGTLTGNYLTTSSASSTYATITNLASTGSTLATNLASTGSTLNTRINNLSGYINSTSSNIVFTTGNQDISGTKTFTDGTLNVSIKPQNSGLEINNGPFIIRSAAGTHGAVRVEVLNENGANGFTVINEGLDLADFGLQSSSDKKINFRMEGRSEYANGNNQEFQVIDVSDNINGVYYARFGNNNIVIGENSEKVGIGTLSPVSKLHIDASATSNSTLKVGTLEFQPYAVNNAWIGDNTYYNGGFYRREAGYAGAFYFQGAEGQFRFADTDDAGTSYSPVVQLKTHLDGRFGVGSNISTSTSDFTNSNFFVNSNGNVGINTLTPSEKLQVNGNVLISGNTTVSGSINISGNYDVYSQIENAKKLAIAYAIAL